MLLAWLDRAAANGQQIGTRAGPRRALCIFQEQAAELWRAAKNVNGNPPLLTHCKHLPCSFVKSGSVRKEHMCTSPRRHQLYYPRASRFHRSITVKASEYWSTSERKSTFLFQGYLEVLHKRVSTKSSHGF